jgi:hypothetical protein
MRNKHALIGRSVPLTAAGCAAVAWRIEVRCCVNSTLRTQQAAATRCGCSRCNTPRWNVKSLWDRSNIPPLIPTRWLRGEIESRTAWESAMPHSPPFLRARTAPPSAHTRTPSQCVSSFLLCPVFPSLCGAFLLLLLLLLSCSALCGSPHTAKAKNSTAQRSGNRRRRSRGSAGHNDRAHGKGTHRRTVCVRAGHSGSDLPVLCGLAVPNGGCF